MNDSICVIVPAYNAEPWLRRCVDSIINQTYRNFELILVDDGSTDQGGAICDEYAARDARVRVIHQANGGLSAARNAGLDWARANSDSEWLSFVDSDDWVHPMYLEALISAARETHSEVVIADFLRTQGEGLPSEPPFEPEIWQTERYYSAHRITSTVLWGKLFARRCFQGMRLPVGKLHEDEYITYKILFRYETVCVIRKPLYAYFQNPKGIMLSHWTPRRLDAIEAVEEQVRFFSERGYALAEREGFRFLAYLYCHGRNCANASADLSIEEKRAYAEALDAGLREWMRRYWKKGWLTVRDKGLFLQAYGVFIPGLRFIRDLGKRVQSIVGEMRRR